MQMRAMQVHAVELSIEFSQTLDSALPVCGISLTIPLSAPRSSVAVLNVCRMDQLKQHQSERVGDDMALAALDPFACITAAKPAIECPYLRYKGSH
jgi:hypothetical protein